jgi:hypothetical protein
MLQNAEALGFDVFDLAWEAWAYTPGAGDVVVARFRDGVDSSVLSVKLDLYAFMTESLANGILRTATEASQVWMYGPFRNTALLDDHRTIVLASQSADVPRAVLTAGPTPIVDLSLRSVARLLDAPTVASLVAGDQCTYVEPKAEALPAEARSLALAALDAAGPLGHFNVVAYAYDWTDDPIGRFVFGYPDEEAAKADLAGRAQLAREGTSLGWGSPANSGIRYADRFFALGDARLAERSIVLRVGPVPFELRSPDPANRSLRTNLLPFTLQQMFELGDMLFAACPE